MTVPPMKSMCFVLLCFINTTGHHLGIVGKAEFGGPIPDLRFCVSTNPWLILGQGIYLKKESASFLSDMLYKGEKRHEVGRGLPEVEDPGVNPQRSSRS